MIHGELHVVLVRLREKARRGGIRRCIEIGRPAHDEATHEDGVGLQAKAAVDRAERVVVITAGLVLAPWGVLPWSLVLLAVTAWVTVAQRVLHVRKQLMEASSE